MNIACLGWGSLVWDPQDLPTRSGWHQDGPLLPVEFARQSRDGRITLVLVWARTRVETLWAEMDADDLKTAIEALRVREGISDANVKNHVGLWMADNLAEATGSGAGVQAVEPIADWALDRGMDAVLWTNLPPKFGDEDDRVPTGDEVIGYLSALRGDKRDRAEEYFRRAPLQIDTEYRRRVQAELVWMPLT